MKKAVLLLDGQIVGTVSKARIECSKNKAQLVDLGVSYCSQLTNLLGSA